MSDTHTRQESPGDPFELPARTTPTWEVEILLSGATVFALFQLYGVVTEGVWPLITSLGSETRGLITTTLVYVQAGVLALALGFVLHLGLRALWVAAVGLRSVDPNGRVRESISLGPAQRALVAHAWEDLPRHVARLDDWSTLTFALSLGLAKLMALLMVIVTLLNASGFAAQWLSGGRVSAGMVVLGLSTLLLGPMMLATLLDNRAGKKGISPPRWVNRVVGWYSSTGMLANQNLALQVLTQRASGDRSRTKGALTVFLLIFTLMTLVSLTSLWQGGLLGTLLGDPLVRTEAGQNAALRGAHYQALQHPGRAQKLPFLPSEIVTGNYARLRLPVVDEWHGKALAACVTKHRGEGDVDAWRFDERADAVLACMASTQPIKLDGTPLQASWVLEEDLGAGKSYFRVMIDVRNLPRGRHLLEIGMPPEAIKRNDKGEQMVWRIPFWT